MHSCVKGWEPQVPFCVHWCERRLGLLTEGYVAGDRLSVSTGMSLVQFSSTLPLKISCVNLVCIPEIYASSPHTSYCSPITFSPLAEILSLGMVALWGSIGSWLMGWRNCTTMEVRYGSRTTQNDSGGRYP